MKRIIKCFSVALSLTSLFIFSLILYGNNNLPDEIKTVNQKIIFSGIYSASFNEYDHVNTCADNQSTKNAEIKLFGSVPVKQVSYEKTERKHVAIGGELVGIRLKTKGVLVVGTESFESETGQCCPAKEAGIEIGDTLVSIDGIKINNNSELSNYIESSGGKTVTAEILRNNEKKLFNITPKISSVSGLYKSGLWIRDSTGGIGTLTYIDFNEGTMATLGHGIYDVDTEQLIPTQEGAFYSASLNGVTKGTNGNAGELKGYIGSDYYGSIHTNCENGIYGNISYFNHNNDCLPVATSDEIKIGKAQIVSTINENGKEYYDVEIEKIINTGENKNLIVKIIDPDLLDVTGGIVQGMSGSPIIQNGMIIGAVTHVFLNDPTKGYGIFIENMMDAA